MGFAKVWNETKVFDIALSAVIELPFHVEAALLNKETVFYAIPAKIPYGLGEKEGKLVVCESHNGGVAIKAWQFDGEEWASCSFGGGIHADEYSKLIQVKVDLDNNYSVFWFPSEKEAWRNPGFAEHYNQYGLIDKTDNHSFAEFMQNYFPVENLNTQKSV